METLTILRLVMAFNSKETQTGDVFLLGHPVSAFETPPEEHAKNTSPGRCILTTFDLEKPSAHAPLRLNPTIMWRELISDISVWDLILSTPHDHRWRQEHRSMLYLSIFSIQKPLKRFPFPHEEKHKTLDTSSALSAKMKCWSYGKTMLLHIISSHVWKQLMTKGLDANSPVLMKVVRRVGHPIIPS